MTNRGSQRVSKQGGKAIQGRLKVKDLPPAGAPRNRRMKRAASKLSKQVGVWRVDVSGYGAFLWVGTKEQAEDIRSHKARWEGGVSIMRRLRDATEAELLKWNEVGPYDGGLVKSELPGREE